MDEFGCFESAARAAVPPPKVADATNLITNRRKVLCHVIAAAEAELMAMDSHGGYAPRYYAGDEPIEDVLQDLVIGARMEDATRTRAGYGHHAALRTLIAQVCRELAELREQVPA